VASSVAPGLRVDYTPSTDIALGAVVVQGDLVGIADRPLPANQLGSLAVQGIFSIAKATGAITAGAKVYWDAAISKVTTTATGNVYVGMAVKAVASGAAEVEVLLAH
jgi:predicted RecA/RadA family phage recombinase